MRHQAEALSSSLLQFQLERERVEREVAVTRDQLLRRDKQCASLEAQVWEVWEVCHDGPYSRESG